MAIIRVAVLRGGPSEEYEVSLQTGGNIINSLHPDKFIVDDIFVSRDGVWHLAGLPTSPEKALSRAGVVFNAMHGAYGEDGGVQRVLEHHNIPFTGSGSLGASLSFNKSLSKDIYKKNYLKTPEHLVIDARAPGELHDIALKIFREFPQPSIIKPISSGSSKDVYFCSSYEDVYTAIDKLSAKGEPFMVEEFIFGKEATCSVVEGFRGEDLHALLPIEIGRSGKIFSYEDKYGINEVTNYCPGRFTKEEASMIGELAKEAHQALGLRHYSRSDFIISPRGIYILETNSLPGLTEHSLLPQSLLASGASVGEFLEHIVGLAIMGRQ